MTGDRSLVLATYTVETPLSLAAAAEAMAGEQSTGTFVALPGETAQLRRRHAAAVVEVEELDTSTSPALVNREPPARQYNRGLVTIAFPLDNIGTALPNLLATVAGNLFELRQLSGIRLEQLRLPAEFGQAHPGPQFAVDGTRRLAGVYGRPIVGTIVKPSVGLTPRETADLAAELAYAGLDFIKDDELMANPPHAPFDERVKAVLRSLHDAAERTGRLPMYAANVTDELDDMLRHAETVAQLGGTCVMVSVNAVGLSALGKLRQRSSLPIHAHRNGWGALTRHPLLGYSFQVWQQLWRLAGADHLHVNGLGSKFWEPDSSVLLSARAVLTPSDGHPAAMPVFSSAQSAAQAEDTFAQLGSYDLMYICGGGIMAHPDGAAAGVASVRQAWTAAISGIPVDSYAQSHPALKRALDTFAEGRSRG